jgi:hypothetical protein
MARTLWPVLQKYRRQRASLSLHYGEMLRVRLRLPASSSPALREAAARRFGFAGLFRDRDLRHFEGVWEKLRAADETTVVYSDVLDFIDRENELASGLEDERRQLAQLASGKNSREGVLKVPLFPYQAGALHGWNNVSDAFTASAKPMPFKPSIC